MEGMSQGVNTDSQATALRKAQILAQIADFLKEMTVQYGYSDAQVASLKTDLIAGVNAFSAAVARPSNSGFSSFR